jgi:hypothetical protein
MERHASIETSLEKPEHGILKMVARLANESLGTEFHADIDGDPSEDETGPLAHLATIKPETLEALQLHTKRSLLPLFNTLPMLTCEGFNLRPYCTNKRSGRTDWFEINAISLTGSNIVAVGYVHEIVQYPLSNPQALDTLICFACHTPVESDHYFSNNPALGTQIHRKDIHSYTLIRSEEINRLTPLAVYPWDSSNPGDLLTIAV